MAEMTLQPTDVEILEEWLEAWRFAVSTLHLLSAKVQGVPTTDAEYRALLDEINTVLNNTSGGVLYYGTGAPIVDTSKEILMMVKGVDPSQTALIGASPVTDVTTTGLEVGGALATAGVGLFSKVGRKILISSIVACLGLEVFAGLLPQEQKTDLYTSLDPYADENGNVLVHTDSDGKTRVPKAYIEAVRGKLIAMGAFDNAGFEPSYALTPNGTIITPMSLDLSEALEIMANHIEGFTVEDYYSYSQITSDNFVNSLRTISQYIKTCPKSKTVNGFGGTDPLTVTFEFPRVTGFARVSNADYRYRFIQVPSITINDQVPYNNINAGTNGSINGFSIDCGNLTTICEVGFNSGAVGDIGDIKTIVLYGTNTQGYTGFQVFVRYVYANNKAIQFPAIITNVVSGGGYPVPARQSTITPVTSYITSSNYMTMRGYGLNSRGLIFNGSSGEPIEGISKQEDAIIPSDPLIDIADYMPAWSTDKKTFKAVSYDENRHIEGLTDIDFYPVTLTGVQGENQDITTPQDDAITGDAPSVSDMDYIFPAIQDFYEFIHNYPDYPDIVIPAGDSGDTPPANPELLSGSSNGLWAIYNPSKSEVQQFGAWLWSSNILDQITRMFNSPIDAVIGFHMIYCTPITGASKTIKAGYLDSPVSAPEVTDQYKDIDCGTIAIPEYYRNALDYDNTRISLFLPFIGIVPLDTAQVMGSSLSILYRIDVLTGTCLAQVSVIKENSNAVMYTYQGNCSVQIPLTATTYTGMVGALLSGISAGASIMTGNILGAVSAGLEGAMRAGTGLTGVRQSGTLGANAGALGIRIPYVIITHPVSVMPDNFNTLEGLPSAELVPLSSVSGFTRVTYVHLENIPATSQEIEEITGLLQTGVIF